MITNNKTVTIIKKVVENKKAIYKAFLFSNCNVVESNKALSEKNGLLDKSVIHIRIPMSSIKNNDVTIEIGDYLTLSSIDEEEITSAVIDKYKAKTITECQYNLDAFTDYCKHIKVIC